MGSFKYLHDIGISVACGFINRITLFTRIPQALSEQRHICERHHSLYTRLLPYW